MMWMDEVPAWQYQSDGQHAGLPPQRWPGWVQRCWVGCMPAAAVDVNDGSHEFPNHSTALNMPTRAAWAPRAVPSGLSRLCCLPQHKVRWVLLAFIDGNTLPCLVIILHIDRHNESACGRFSARSSDAHIWKAASGHHFSDVATTHANAHAKCTTPSNSPGSAPTGGQSHRCCRQRTTRSHLPHSHAQL